MNRVVQFGLLVCLCILPIQSTGQGQGKGKGNKPKDEPPRLFMASRFYDSFPRAVDAGVGSEYPWFSVRASVGSPARGEKSVDTDVAGSMSMWDYEISSGIGEADFSITNAYLSFYLYTDTTPDGGDEIVRFINNLGVQKASLRWEANTRKLDFFYVGGSSLGSTVLALDTWYRVDVKVGTGASADWEVRVHEDGSPGTSIEISGTNDLTTSPTGRIQVTTTTNHDHFVSHFHLEDSAYVADGNDYRVETLFPDGDGNYTAWTGDWTDVDDIKHDSTTTEITTSTNLARQTVTLENLTLATGESILGVMNVYHMRKTSNAATNVQVIDRAGTTDRDSTSFELAKNDVSNQDQKWFVLYDTKPGGGAFSESDINGYEIGLEHNQAQAREIFCTAMNCNVLIEMPAPSSAANIYHHLQNLGVY